MNPTPVEHSNRLSGETSPYLLQHAGNPVDWYPWGPEALALAKEQNKPIFLSIGYSACHWCHVMERESFENQAIAKLMNANFINIKVDREERPDLDDIYMKAVQAMTGQGGWPMSVFLTPDLEPFFGGTYFPPDNRYGRPGFSSVLTSIHENWMTSSDRLVKQGQRLREMIQKEAESASSAELDTDLIARSITSHSDNFDGTWGGFGHAPKFPHSLDIRLCLREWKRSGNPHALHMATLSLDRMSEGGVYDQLGGGFHRYSTDEMWLIPHFEKMLYDNALLIPAYLEGYLATGNHRYSRIAAECCDWILREMVTEEGGFASTQDADSEGEEGVFFSWTPADIERVLGKELGDWATEWFGVIPEGNFERGLSALWRHDAAAEVAARLSVDRDELIEAMVGARQQLLDARNQRVRPDTDDKVLSSWNGLTISALAQAYQVLGDDRYLDAARTAAKFVLQSMRQSDGRLFATSRHGVAHLNAYLADYSYMIAGLIDLYESDFNEYWIHEALELTSQLEEHFLDRKQGGFFTTGDRHEKLIARLKEPHDGALPSAGAVHALNLLRLAELTSDARLLSIAETTIRSVGKLANRYPTAFSQMLIAVDFQTAEPLEIVVSGEPTDPATQALLKQVRQTFRPQRVVALAHAKADATLLPLVTDRCTEGASPAAFVCRNQTCEFPVHTPVCLEQQLNK
ncbi:MAG: hypothetical protein ACI8TQ_003852 [Planctomycetota bacterium]|jgi:uncharacterized protein YyaL (SSP411 family)